jgi:hypothetical protein
MAEKRVPPKPKPMKKRTNLWVDPFIVAAVNSSPPKPTAWQQSQLAL